MAYQIFPFFAFRTPLLPFNEQFLGCDGNALFNHFSNPHIQEAIFLASPALYREIEKVIAAAISNQKEIDRIIDAFVRYLSRIHTRCTPFGLFVGCGTGKVSESADTSVLLGDTYKRKTRLDMLFQYALYDAIVQMPDIKAKIRYYPNSSLYLLGNKFRYVESVNTPTGVMYRLSETEQSIYLNKVLKAATKGANMEVLINSLTNETILEEDASEFISALIDAQVLVGELSRATTGSDFFDRMIHLMESINEQNRLLKLFKEIRTALDKADINRNGIETYQHILSLVQQTNIPYQEKFLFQVDTIIEPLSASLGSKVIDELKSALSFLNRTQTTWKNERLEKFRQDFYQRYEDREVALMEALDSEIGLGYPSKSHDGDPSPLIDDFVLPQPEEQMLPTQGGYKEAFITLLHKKAFECLSQNQQEIVFEDKDIKDFPVFWDNMPPTMYTIFEMIRSKPDDVLVALDFFSGSGANLLARFAHTDKNMDTFVKEITAKEQSLTPEVIQAEIVHLPEERISNVLFRPHIRDYEIVYLASSDMPHDQLLTVADLMLSVKNNRLIIRSKTTGKEVLPRLTTAHNYHKGLPVYRFLCDMDKQAGRYGLKFDWGAYRHYFRPRVRYKNTILSPATWILEQSQMKQLFGIREDDRLIAAIETWRKQYGMPRFVLMIESDNKLWVDLENVLSIRSLFSIIKDKPTVIFTEFLFEPENAVVKDKKGNVYTNECIAVFHK